MARTKSSEQKELDAVREEAKEIGLYLPHTRDWRKLARDLQLPTDSHQVFTVNWTQGESHSRMVRHFGMETVRAIPAVDYLEFFDRQRYDRLSPAARSSIFESWIRRSRIFNFPHAPDSGTLATISPFASRTQPAYPFVEAIWQQGHVDTIAMFGLARYGPDQRRECAALFTAALSLVFSDTSFADLAVLIDAVGRLPKKQLKPHGGSKPKYDLSSLKHYYKLAYKKWKDAKVIYRQNRNRDWFAMVKVQHADLPDDLINRLPTVPNLPDEILAKLVEKGGASTPSDIALEHAARLCGVPDYTYTIGWLWTFPGQQKKPLIKKKKQKR